MKKLAFSLLIIMLTTNLTLAQKKVFFESTIIEEDTQVPVNGATITIEEKNVNTITDEKGHFSFNETLEEGSYVVSIKKEGYEPKVFLLEQKEGFKIKLKESIGIMVTKKEAKRRRDEAKEKEKEAEKRMKDLEKEREKKEKELKKQKKLLSKENTVQVEYLDSAVKEEPEEEEPEEEITENQIKYSEILGVDVLELTNKELYNFIDTWIGTPYLMGGETKKAIDCSSFSQRLYISAYDRMYLERTAQKQFDSEFTELFDNKEHLREGDLIFFGKDPSTITHVGVYLQNSKFVHSTSATSDGPSGVKISDLSNPYWSNKFLSAGRRKKNN